MKIKALVKNERYVAIFEQGLISIQAFLLIGGLGLYVQGDDFKKFVQAYSVVSLLFLLGACISSQPLSIYAPRHAYRSLLFKITISTAALALFALMIPLMLVANRYYSFTLLECFACVAYTLAWVLQDSYRKFAYATGERQILTTASVFLTVSLVILLAFSYFLNLSWSIALFFFALFLFLYSAILHGRLLPSVFKKIGKEIVNSKAIIRKNFDYGLKSFMGVFAFWFYSQGVILYFASTTSGFEVNQVRISQNLAGLLSIFFLAYENMMLPRFSRLVGESSKKLRDQYASSSRRWRFAIALLSIISVATVAITQDLVYTKFGSVSYLQIALVVLSQVALGFSRPEIVLLKALDQPKAVTYCHFAAVVAAPISIGILSSVMSGGLLLATTLFLSALFFSVTACLISRIKIKEFVK